MTPEERENRKKTIGFFLGALALIALVIIYVKQLKEAEY